MQLLCITKWQPEKTAQQNFSMRWPAGETITGLITATTLVYPDKKLSSGKNQISNQTNETKSFCSLSKT